MERRILANCAIRVAGRLERAEAEQPDPPPFQGRRLASICEPERQLRLPFADIGLLSRVGEVELKAATPALAFVRLRYVPGQSARRGPVEQLGRGGHQSVRSARVSHDGEPPVRQRPGTDIAIVVNRRRDRNAGLDPKLPLHVDDVIAEERRAACAIPRAPSQPKISGMRSATEPMVAMVTQAEMPA